MNRTHQTFSAQEKDKLLREVKHLYHVFAVFTLAVRSLMSSVQSARRVSKADEGSTSSPSRKSSSQYSVSAASLSAIWSFDAKSDLLCAYRLSAMFAPTEVPDRSICFAMTDSFRSRKYLYKRTVRRAKALDFVSKMLSFMLCAFLLAGLGYSE